MKGEINSRIAGFYAEIKAEPQKFGTIVNEYIVAIRGLEERTTDIDEKNKIDLVLLILTVASHIDQRVTKIDFGMNGLIGRLDSIETRLKRLEKD